MMNINVEFDSLLNQRFFKIKIFKTNEIKSVDITLKCLSYLLLYKIVINLENLK